MYKQNTYQGVNHLILGSLFPQKQNIEIDENSQTTKTSNQSPKLAESINKKSMFEQGNLFMNNISVSHSNKYNKTESDSNILGHTDKFNASEFLAS